MPSHFRLVSIYIIAFARSTTLPTGHTAFSMAARLVVKLALLSGLCHALRIRPPVATLPRRAVTAAIPAVLLVHPGL